MLHHPENLIKIYPAIHDAQLSDLVKTIQSFDSKWSTVWLVSFMKDETSIESPQKALSTWYGDGQGKLTAYLEERIFLGETLKSFVKGALYLPLGNLNAKNAYQTLSFFTLDLRKALFSPSSFPSWRPLFQDFLKQVKKHVRWITKPV